MTATNPISARPDDIREMAKALARRGLRIFPTIRNGKTPAVPVWEAKATTDPATIDRLWRTGDGIGVATGPSRLLVLDVDEKNGKSGGETLDRLELEHDDLPATFSVTTPSGGKHLYFRLPEGENAGSSAGRLGPGLDVRASGGYVVGPGTVIDSRRYEIESDLPVAVAPAWLIELAGRPVEREPGAAAPVAALDLPPSIERARAWLRDHAPEAIEGAGGNATTYRVAARLKDFGLSEFLTFELLDEPAGWNERKAAPPWLPEDLATIVGNAYRYGNNPPGVSNPAADFDPIPLEQRAPAAERQPARQPDERPRWARFTPIACADIKPDLARRELVGDLLDMDSLAMLYGASNVGKSFVALDLALHVAAGAPWRGRRVEQGPAVYIAAEGRAGVVNRIAAWKARYGHHDAPMHVITAPPDLRSRDSDDCRDLIEAIRQTVGQPVLIVFDTFARVTAGADENSGRDMTSAVDAIDAVRRAFGATALIVHHSGKNATSGARGHSSIRAAVDTELHLTAKGGALFLANGKQRDRAKGGPLHMELEAVALGFNEHDGRPVTSAVIRPLPMGRDDFDPLGERQAAPPSPPAPPAGAPEQPSAPSSQLIGQPPSGLSPDADAIFTWLKEAGGFLPRQTVTGVPGQERIAAARQARGEAVGKREALRRQARRTLGQLEQNGLIVVDGDRVKLAAGG